MNVECHVLCFQEEEFLPYCLRHYNSFCNRIIVHDAFSTDRSREIAKEYGAEVRDWATDGLNDAVSKKLKEDCVMQCKSDWCLVVDTDEIWYFPFGPSYTLSAYDSQGLAVIRPHGFEMVSDVFPTTAGQVYDEVKFAGVDDRWYAKCALVAPPRIKSIIYSAGAHETWAVLKDGSKWNDVKEKTDPPSYFLHCKHLGPIERIARKYDVQRTRLSARNIKEKWGNFDPGIVHAKEKREAIMSTVRRVID